MAKKPPAGSGLQMQSSFGGGGGQGHFEGGSPKRKGKKAAASQTDEPPIKRFDEEWFRMRMHGKDWRLFKATSMADAKKQAQKENIQAQEYQRKKGSERYSHINLASCKYEGGYDYGSGMVHKYSFLEISKPVSNKGTPKAATKPPRTPTPSPLAVPMGLGGGGIPPIPGVGAAAAPKPVSVPPALAPAAAPKRKKTAKAATKKPAPAGTVLTAAQKKRLAAKGSITIKRGGKFVTVTR